MRRKVIVLGKAFCQLTDKQERFYEHFGKWLAEENFDVITGACPGVAYSIGKKILKEGGRVFGYSPARCLTDHKKVYHFPTAGCSSILYEEKKLAFNEAYFHRSVRMFFDNKSSVVVSFGGGRGTFSELCLAFFMSRTIVLPTFTGGATAAFFYFSKLFKLFKLNYNSDIIRVKSPAELSHVLLSLYRDAS